MDSAVDTAIILATDRYRSGCAKTAHGLVRGPSRFPVAAVIDATCAGQDAGTLLDGRARQIPIFASVGAALAGLPRPPRYCLLGVATAGGVMPDDMRDGLLEAAAAGMTLVNGLHRLLADDAELVERVALGGGQIIDIRRPRPTRELHFWTGEVLSLPTPRVAVLGMDCAIGKRTTAQLLRQRLRADGLRAEMVYTGQTGWLQGMEHGFIFDATPNDFVCGELERAVLDCARDTKADVILLEGQSALRNPTGPCGSELILSAAATGVILQHAPARKCYIDIHSSSRAIGSVADEIRLIALLGAEVWAVCLNVEGMEPATVEGVRAGLEEELRIAVVLPLQEQGIANLAAVVRARLGMAAG